MRDEWVNNLPQNWQAKPLHAVADCLVSNVDKISVEGEHPVRLCNYTDVYNNEFIRSSMDFMRGTASEREVARFNLLVGDVIITKDSESWEDIGVPALVAETADDLVCGYHLALLRPKADVLGGRFLLRTLQTRQVQIQLELAAKGMTRFGLPKFEIGKTILPIPPLCSQLAIADYIDRETACLDALIAAKQRLSELLSEKRQALINRAVTHGLRRHTATKRSGVDWLGDVPIHWQVNRLKFVAPIRSSKLTSVPVGQVYVGLEHIESQTGRLHIYASAPEVESVGASFAAGDVLFGKLRPYLAKVGRPTVSGVSTSEIVALQPVGCLQGYLFYALLNASFIRWIDSLTFGSKMPRVSPEQVANSFIAVPPEVEQRAIIAFLDRQTAKIDALVAEVREAVGLLKERRVALISAAVTGRIAVDA